jgi:hypothetical protein
LIAKKTKLVKKRGEKMFTKNKKEVIPFKEFMSLPAKRIHQETPLNTSIYSFFPPITIKSFFPVHDLGFSLFLIGGAVILAVALADRFLMSTDTSEIGMYLSSFVKVAFPVVGFGSILWLFSQL